LIELQAIIYDIECALLAGRHACFAQGAALLVVEDLRPRALALWIVAPFTGEGTTF
jgi:hypothetical protein